MSSARLGVAAALAAVIACGDPVHSNAVDALGGEAAGVAPGPTHRPGQPCLVCHGGSGPAGKTFSFAGTVYQSQPTRDPLDGAQITITDAAKATHTVKSNGVGNFYVEEAAFSPAYPVHVSVAFLGTTADMTTHIGRDGSCASCHADPAGPASHGHVYLVEDPASFPMSAP